MVASETTPLIAVPRIEAAPLTLAASDSSSRWLHDRRQRLHLFLEAETPAGRCYERFIMILIFVNVMAFILGSLFVQKYNKADWASRKHGLCGTLCDSLWFGNYQDNLLEFLNIGSTSVLEILTVAIFSVEYMLRLYTADLESELYKGFWGRIRYVPTFFSVIDLVSTLPFYIDSFLLRNSNIAASSFLRMFRLLRMMRVEGRYDTALTMMDDVYAAQKSILFTALFVGITTWMAVSSLYYLAERRNPDMIYCPTCGDDVDHAECEIDSWGYVNCSLAGCPGTEHDERPCYNLYESIPMASYYSLLNLFGEYPLINQHSTYGKIVGTLTAAVAVAIFALPAGIIGNGFETVISRRHKDQDAAEQPIVEEGRTTCGFQATNETLRGRVYNVLHAQTGWGALLLDHGVNILVVTTSISFMLDTLRSLPWRARLVLDIIELLSVSIFTAEYTLRVWSVAEDPKYIEAPAGGRFLYATSFLAVMDLLSFAPYWFEVLLTGRIFPSLSGEGSEWGYLVKSLRLLRILRFERYTHAFLSFDDVIQRNVDILAVTAFTAILFWIFFASCLYFTERDSPDEEMASFYNTIPNSMWVTLLNLSGESPLAQYSAAGKVLTGIVGLFATAIFGIPIGVLGAGFQDVVAEENDDNTENLPPPMSEESAAPAGHRIERATFDFVNGNGSRIARYFEITIYVLIFATVAVGALQTVEGYENMFHQVEWISVAVFTAEYVLRLIGAGADPDFACESFLKTRLRFIISFYSVIDLLAIVPFYISYALPASFVNDYDEYLRMLRILRLLKLDKYIPSISLIDDVVRLKYNSLKVAFYAAVTLWILFSAALFLCEHDDTSNEIDPVPLYSCGVDCSMTDRFRNYFDSMVYTAIHLSGDYPIITYSWAARLVCFFMVIAAVGVVSVPSGLIASGFVEVVRSKHEGQHDGQVSSGEQRAGDDWYEDRYRALEGVNPPASKWGEWVDQWQFTVNRFLNGTRMPNGHHVWTTAGYFARVFIFSVIILNVLAVLLESVPAIDEAVGNEKGNLFDRFEFFSVMVFATEYALRLFCAPKNREALYSSFVYATTFFGIVDFLSTAPWFVQQALTVTGWLDADGDGARIFRIFRVFRILQLEDFLTAFSKLDNVFRASKDVLKATTLLAVIIWIGCGALFFIAEADNPNWRECDSSIPLYGSHKKPGCYDFSSTLECNEFYPGLCQQAAFTSMPNSLYYTAVFLGGEWGLVDFTWPGRLICMFLCVAGIGLYAVPIGTLFTSFGEVLGLVDDDDDDDDDETSEDDQDD
ncbi:hypothetical protein MPSEU_000853300 [Mayamaea pseudoterrestris]|nr:hypothetical protein MPSEU_000853300 [Mayamaea pseudoterrestris]